MGQHSKHSDPEAGTISILLMTDTRHREVKVVCPQRVADLGFEMRFITQQPSVNEVKNEIKPHFTPECFHANLLLFFLPRHSSLCVRVF